MNEFFQTVDVAGLKLKKDNGLLKLLASYITSFLINGAEFLIN